MVIEHLLAAIVVGLLVAVLLAGSFLVVVKALYFGSSRPRRRMPAWLIVAVLIAFLIMPKIDTVYALGRRGEKGQQEA